MTGENFHCGTPINPASPSLVPGGSCSGAAVAVAAQLADFALGIRLLPTSSSDYKSPIVLVNETFSIFLAMPWRNVVCMCNGVTFCSFHFSICFFPSIPDLLGS